MVDLDGAGARVTNVLAGGAAAVSSAGLALLLALAEWDDAEAAFERLAGGHDRGELARILITLLDANALVVEGSPEAALDERYAQRWVWGDGAAHWFLAQKNPRWLQPDAVRDLLTAQLATRPPPPLWISHRDRDDRLGLPPPGEDPLLSILRQRRSSRGFDPERALPLPAVASCLHAGFTVVGFFDGSVGEGELPLGLAPSGGARHPYEAYLLAPRVDGLAPGIYHYSGVEHSLVPVPAAEVPAVAAALGDQSWFAAAPAVILLVAHFERTAWKYTHPGALRVMLIEAGHIAQNVLLRASTLGLAATPTCALADRVVEQALGLDPVIQAAVYAIGIGVQGEPSPSDPSGVRYR